MTTPDKFALNQSLWLSELEGDADSAFLSDGVLFGFKLTGVDTTFKEVDMQNYKWATNSGVRDTAEETIRDEIRQGNYVISATKPKVVSALGAIQKSPPPPPRFPSRIRSFTS